MTVAVDEVKVREALVTLLTGSFRVPAENLKPEADLIDDFGLDSIDLVDLLALLNEKFDIFLSPSDFEGCRKLAQFEERLNTLLKK